MNPQTDESWPDENHAKVDMSPEAIDQRLDMVSALYDLGKYLQTARPVEESADQTGDSCADGNA
jgi:hypothetical protein